MAITFTTFNNRLPDPTFGVNDSGVIDATGVKGPGFASVRLTDIEDNQVSRTISGSGVHRSNASQHWEFSIKYNPLTRDQFDVVDTFLQTRKGRRFPFFVVFPQYAKSKNPVFANLALTVQFRAPQATAAGSDKLLIDGNGAAVASYPKPGDFFTISDTGNINHLKAYKITRVETSEYYQAGTTPPPTNSFRVWTNPPLQKFTNSGAIINFNNPKFRVIQKGDTIENELDTENTYQFGLELEEIMP